MEHESVAGNQPCVCHIGVFFLNNDYYGSISWPARLPHLLACDLYVRDCLKSRLFLTRSADLYSLELNISLEINTISPVMSA